MERLLFIILCSLLISISARAKPKTEIQLGLSYNTLRSSTYNGIQPQEIINYNQFTARPIMRLLLISKTKRNFSIGTFIGYHTMGGRFKSDTSHYKESIYRHSLEFGIMPSYTIMKLIQIGIGAKFNINPVSFNRHYGTLNQSDALPREWVNENVTSKYKKYSSNIGFNIKHQCDKLSFSFETWLGILNSGNLNSLTYRTESNEKNFRLILGYTLSKKKAKEKNKSK